MEEMKPLNVAMVGSKGLPAIFGGIERHVEEVGRRLVERGLNVTVFGRKPFSKNGEHLGMEVRVLPSIPTKNLETATNSLAVSLKVLFEPFDIIHYHGVGPSIFSFIPASMGKTTVATIHAPDYRQKKWGPVARALLRLGERTAVRHCTASIAVSKMMTSALEVTYNHPVHYIPNGATLVDPPPFHEARKFGIEGGRYILTVGRFIYERGFHTLLKAFSMVETDQRLVIVGDARFEEEYASQLRTLADERVVFPGYISGNLLNELYAHCSFYVLPSLVEGLPISLLEAMSFSRPVLISDIPENVEVADGIAVAFKRDDPADLAKAFTGMLNMEADERMKRGALGRKRVEEHYTWDAVTSEIEKLYRKVLTGRKERKYKHRNAA